ncbi:dopamine N-acetyltransferase isoform X2 [Orussus abietinus]|uniref:dopamine N-acetyltransferase isoform X2 n=1 Tax=Orussus abietinus TaxID=222816 RepID=UPI0006266E56|nr:dopamine N-acetyltransferase isoform X2 [Orussus abietinus]
MLVNGVSRDRMITTLSVAVSSPVSTPTVHGPFTDRTRTDRRCLSTSSGKISTDLHPRVPMEKLADSSNDPSMDYHIQVITPDDAPRVLKFLKRFFFRDEPLNYSIELIPPGENSTCVELEEYSISSIEENLSLMAVSTSGAVIGVCLNGRTSAPKDAEPDYIADCANPKFKKVLKLLYFLDKQVTATGRYTGENGVELRIISVDSNWRGRGVARALIEKTIETAKERGFSIIRCDCTSVFSAKLCARIGFEKIYELKYEDYVDEEGKPIFSPDSPHTSATSYTKKL